MHIGSLVQTMAAVSLGLQDVPQDVKFPEEELKVLEYWDKVDAFQTSLR